MMEIKIQTEKYLLFCLIQRRSTRAFVFVLLSLFRLPSGRSDDQRMKRMTKNDIRFEMKETKLTNAMNAVKKKIESKKIKFENSTNGQMRFRSISQFDTLQLHVSLN